MRKEVIEKLNIRELIEEAEEGDCLFVDEFMDKYKIVRGEGFSYYFHRFLIDYRKKILRNRNSIRRRHVERHIRKVKEAVKRLRLRN